MAQITTGLIGNPTAHYSFSYDSSLRRTVFNPTGPEPARTNALIRACEADFNWMSGLFGNPALDYNIPCTVQVTQNSGGARWSLSGGNLTVTLNPGFQRANDLDCRRALRRRKTLRCARG